MNPRKIAIIAFFALFASGLCPLGEAAAQSQRGITEYAMIRFDGRQHSQIVWPDGRVEFMDSIAPQADSLPQFTDERIYVTTLLMNKLAKEGFAFVALISTEQVLMSRTR